MVHLDAGRRGLPVPGDVDVGMELARGAGLHGTNAHVGVLFVDIVGSTRLAVNRPPREVVDLLNEFFRVVVAVVGRHGGFVNKFQGDAALAIFGAPLNLNDFAGQALAAAREMRQELWETLGDTDIGIGVSAGKAIAGHIGSEQRLEYTVIGDPVNEAARLTELAKDEPTRVLGSARAVFLASSEEAKNWDIGEGVELRGRGIETLLARPHLSDPAWSLRQAAAAGCDAVADDAPCGVGGDDGEPVDPCRVAPQAVEDVSLFGRGKGCERHLTDGGDVIGGFGTRVPFCGVGVL